MHTFGELVVVDPRTLRPVVGVAQVTDAVTGDPVATFTTEGDPAPVVSSSRGYVGQFQTPDGHPQVRLTFPAGDPVVVTALDQVAKAAEAVEEMTTGRLSPASLSTTIATEVVDKAGTVPIFGTQAEALAWEADHPGAAALWFDAGYTEVTATGPTWTDNVTDGGGTWTTPTQAGVTYQPASGTASPGQTITVTANAKPGYAIIGPRTWTHTFPVPVFSAFNGFASGTSAMTSKWVAGTWAGADDATATDGKVLILTGATGARRGLAWDADYPEPATDVEALIRVKVPIVTGVLTAAVAVRGSGAAGVETGYFAGLIRPGVDADVHLALNKFVAGTYSKLGQGPSASTLAANTWVWVRLRAQGSMIQTKAWRDDATEPTAWDLTVTDTDIPAAGWVGLFASAGHEARWDNLSLALDGGTAPKAPR